MGIKQVFNPLSGNFDLITTIDDPVQQSFSISNNVSNASLGLSFNYLTRNYFALVYSVTRNVTGTEIVESGELRGVYQTTTSTWFISNTFTGPGAGITFSMDSSGNVLYTTTNLAGTSYTGTMKLYIDHLIAGGAGESNTASNLGAGSGTFASKVGADLQFKSLVAGSNVSLSSTATEITISSSEIKPTYTLPALDVDWSQGYIFYKDISANSTFTFSNTLDGKTISLIIKNTSLSTCNITLPTVIKEATLGLSVDAGNQNIYTFIKSGSNVYVTAVTQMS